MRPTLTPPNQEATENGGETELQTPDVYRFRHAEAKNGFPQLAPVKSTGGTLPSTKRNLMADEWHGRQPPSVPWTDSEKSSAYERTLLGL